MPDEREVTNSYSQYENSSGQLCYKYTVYCTAPLNKEPVPDVAKVIKSQAQVDCVMIPYERKIE